jgi:hypothetical protein
VLRATATSVTLGVQIARFLPEPSRIFTLTWEGQQWTRDEVVQDGSRESLVYPRWLSGPDGSVRLFAQGESSRGLYQRPAVW